MTSIRKGVISNFFPSSTIPLITTPSPAKSEIKSIPISRPDHKLIVSNMKSVINSVKMQKKAKKRKRNRDEPQEIHDISKILKSNLSFISPNRAGTAEECTEETSKGTSILDTFSAAKSSDKPVSVSIETEDVLDNSSKENNSIDVNTTKACSQSSRNEEETKSKTNAFEFMMTARNKSIGTNSPGKDTPNKPVAPTNGKCEEGNVKRRLMLEEWAERKGRAKKRLIEAAGDKYIEVVMKKRAKRLKNLIENGNKQKDSESSDEEHLVKRPNGKMITKRRNKIVESDDSNDDDKKDQHESSASSTNSPKELVSANEKRKNKPATDQHFVEKLSSPIKKRDSLFGYFSKLTKSPTKKATPSTIEDVSSNKISSRKRGRPRKTLTVEEKTEKPSESDNQRESTPSPSPILIPDSPKELSEGRPKRLCRDKKISYFIDEDYTPSKSAVKQSKSTNPTKLAPIFAKATPKAVIDPVVLRARHEFLMSGLPENMKLEMEKQRQFEELYEIEFEMFPKVSHVGHRVGSSDVLDLATLNVRFRCESRDDEENTFSFSQSKLIKIEKSDLEQSSNEIQTLVHQKELMKKLKSNDESQFPYFRCFKQLKRKHLTHLMEEEEGDLSVELIIDKVASANGYLTFTEQYKPMTTSEILINSKPLLELKKFLSSWQENEDGRQGSDNDFDINSSSSFSVSSFNKAIVLTGPPGCGKTSFVYALANEMNFKVLEINAGAKRTGKRVLQKLQEATQSHHVNNNQCSQNDRLNLLKKTKSKSSQSEDSEDSGGSQKLSLILIEDAEVVFEQDFGFVESINQLITMSKRPVILITNQIKCAHLSRFISKNTISFHAPKPKIASKWFSTLSVLEQCYLTVDMCQSLYRQNNCDFRKTLLEVQFFIQSGANSNSQTNNSTNDECGNDDKLVACTTHNRLYDLFHKDQNRLDVILPFPVDFMTLSNKSNEILKSKNMSSDNDSKSSSDSLSNSLEFLNMLSTAQWFDHRTDSSDRVVNHISDEINHFLVEQSVKSHLEWNSESACTEHIVTRPRLASIISSPNYHSSRSFNVDVEPCLRSICRSEFKRSQTERRSSRFYHYLRNANTNSFGTKVFDHHCSILDEEESKQQHVLTA